MNYLCETECTLVGGARGFCYAYTDPNPYLLVNTRKLGVCSNHSLTTLNVSVLSTCSHSVDSFSLHTYEVSHLTILPRCTRALSTQRMFFGPNF